MHLACVAGHTGCVSFLIQKEADVHRRDNRGDTPLHFAARNGQAEVLRILRDAGAYPLEKNSHGSLPIHVAVNGGHTSCVKYFLDTTVGKEDLDQEEPRFSPLVLCADDSGVTPLHIAAHRGHVDIVLCLLRYGDIAELLSAKDSFGAVPLHMAAAAGHLHVIRELLLNDASAEEMDEVGLKPVQWAQKNGKMDAVSLFEDLRPLVEKLHQRREKNRQRKERKRRERVAKDVSEYEGGPAVISELGAASVVAVLEPDSIPVNELLALSLEKEEDGVIGKIRINEAVTLGFGGHGSMVFSGHFETRKAAIKRMVKELRPIARKEVSLLVDVLEENHHPGILRYYGSEEDDEYIYVAMERYEQTLEQFVGDPAYSWHPNLSPISQRIGVPASPLEYSALAMRFTQELASAVQFLHSLKIAHNNLKPVNILITTRLALKVADLVSAQNFNTQNELAPEERPWDPQCGFLPPGAISPDPQAEILGNRDVFSLGCLIYFLFSRGKSPFAGKTSAETESNIAEGRYDLSELASMYEAQHLVKAMIQKDPTRRPSIEQVLTHPFFWTNAKRLQAIEELSDALATRDQERLEEQFATHLVRGSPWLDRLDQPMLADLQSHRNYTSSAFDLVRTIRNISQHFKKRTDGFFACLHDPALDADFESWKEACFEDPDLRATAIMRYFLHPKRFPWLAVEASVFRGGWKG